MNLPVSGQKCLCEDPVMVRLADFYRELIAHEGFGELRIDVRILKRRQKEVIITCGRQYRYVVDLPEGDDEIEPAGNGREEP